MTDTAAILAKLEPLIGVDFGPEVYEIEKGMIARYVDAIGDDNPKWREQAPPTFAAALQPTALLHELYHEDIPLPHLLNGTSELEYIRPVRPGDVIAVTARLVRTKMTKTSAGMTLFMDVAMTFTNQHGEIAVKGKNTYVRY